MRRLAVLALAGLCASSVTAQPHGPIPTESRSGTTGIIGVGVLLGLGAKRPSDEPPADGPDLVMRDQALPDVIPGQVLFFIKGNEADARRIARQARVTQSSLVPLAEMEVSMVIARLSGADTVASAVSRLGAVAGVEWAQPDYQFQVLGSSRDLGVGLSKIRLGPRFRVSGSIAMIDSPVHLANQALEGAVISQEGFGSEMTPAAHGTAVAEILVGTGPFSGIAQGARLYSLVAFAPGGVDWWRSQSSLILQAANRALALRPNVVNMSFGTRLDDPGLARAMDRFEARGICVVAAAGNGAGGPVLFPARHPFALAVTAVDGGKRIYAYASRGPEIDVSAWGVAMNAAVPGGRRAVSGTSFATAVVSGALLRFPACVRDHRPSAMRSAVAAGALDLGNKGRDDVFGAGLFRMN